MSSYGVGYSGTAPTEAQLVAADRTYVASSSVGCLVFHGSGDAALSPYQRPYGSGIPGTGLIEALARRGIPSMTADWGGGNPWGNDTAIARTTDGFNYLTTTAAAFAQGSPGKVLLAGFSMGACNALNWATRNPTKVAGIAIGIPIVDLQHAHDDGVAAAAMETAYGGLAGLQAAYATHSPINFAASLAGIPVAAWYGNPDTDAVVRSADVQAFAAAVGSSCELHSLGAAGHSSSLVPADDMAAFLAR